jgi:hypothetical protein
VTSLSSEVSDIRTKNDRAEKFDSNGGRSARGFRCRAGPRVDLGLQQTASCAWNCRSDFETSSAKKKKKGKILWPTWWRRATTSMRSLPEPQSQVVIGFFLKRARKKLEKVTTILAGCYTHHHQYVPGLAVPSTRETRDCRFFLSRRDHERADSGGAGLSRLAHFFPNRSTCRRCNAESCRSRNAADGSV